MTLLESNKSAFPVTQLASAQLDHEAMADAMLDQIFTDLEQSFDDEVIEGTYAYFETRPPLPTHRLPTVTSLLGGLIGLVALSGIGFWLSSHLLTQWLTPLPRVTQLDAPSEFDLQTLDPNWEPVGTLTADPPPPSTINVDAVAELVSPQPEPTAQVSPARPVIPPQPRYVAQTVSTQPTPPMKLVGIVREPGPPAALIRVNGIVQHVSLGHAIQDNWKVVNIAPHGVGISNGQQNVMLQL